METKPDSHFDESHSSEFMTWFFACQQPSIILGRLSKLTKSATPSEGLKTTRCSPTCSENERRVKSLLEEKIDPACKINNGQNRT